VAERDGDEDGFAVPIGGEYEWYWGCGEYRTWYASQSVDHGLHGEILMVAQRKERCRSRWRWRRGWYTGKSRGGDMIRMRCFSWNSIRMSQMTSDARCVQQMHMDAHAGKSTCHEVVKGDKRTPDHQFLSISLDNGSVSISYSTSTFGPAHRQFVYSSTHKTTTHVSSHPSSDLEGVLSASSQLL